jgi:trimethylamine---corrinoid protein Co-methyltransferase
LAGANLLYGLGMIDAGMTFDFGQLVMDNDFARMIRYTVGGFEVNDETLAVDVTREVGPFSDFLSHDQTYKYMRHQSRPRHLNRETRGTWEIAGSKSLPESALEEARHLLETHQPDPLGEGVAEAMEAIIAAAERERGVA